MDLVCIRRKYRSKRRAIIIIFFLIVLIYIFLIANYIYAERKRETIFEQDFRLASEIMKEQELKKQEEQEILLQPKILTAQEIERINNIYKTEEKQVFLTFDDGPSRKVTIPILDILKQENVKANFFVLGSRVELYPDIVKRAYEEGHYIANHGYSHEYAKIYASTYSVLEEYNKTNQAVKNAIGDNIYNTNIFRFPGGSVGGTYNDLKAEAKILLEQNNIVSVDWNALNGDSEGLNTEEQLINRVKETMENKNSVVILMHDAGNKEKTYSSLTKIIQNLKQEGYQFKTFYDILDK